MKRLLSVALIISLLAVFPQVTPAVAEDAPQTVLPSDEVMPWENNSDNVLSKIHVYLGDEDYATIDSAEELEESIEYVNSLGDSAQTYSANARSVENDEKLQLTVQFESDFHNLPEVVELRERRENVTTIEESNELRRQLLDVSHRYHKELIEKNDTLLRELGYTNYTSANYAPYVQVEITPQDLTANTIMCLADSMFVENVCIDIPKTANISESDVVSASTTSSNESATKVMLSWNAAKAFVNGLSIIQSRTYSGDGVKIGIYDGHICDKNAEELEDLNITTIPGATVVGPSHDKYNSMLHANLVTSIIGNIVPDAEFYSAYGDNILATLDWFVDQGCSVINTSVSWSYNGKDSNNNYTILGYGYEYSCDGIFDYISSANWVTIVVAAGNRIEDPKNSLYNPNNQVTSPGYAYNAITVGGVARYSDNTTRHDTGACYQSGTQTKPNISAMSYYTSPVGNQVGGTSIAAPMVTGAIAMLIDKFPEIAEYPERIMAGLCATADTVYGYTTNWESYIDPKVGAGLLNINRLLSDFTSISYFIEDPEENSFVREYEISLSVGDELQCSFACNFETTATGMPYSANYMIVLYEPDNSNNTYPDDASVLYNSNMQLIRHTAQMTGTYRLLILLDGSVNPNVTRDWFAIAYDIN